MQCVGEWSFLEPLLQGVVFKREDNSLSPEAQPPSGAEQKCAARTDTVAKQTVVLCRGWGVLSAKTRRPPPLEEVGLGGSSQSSLSQTQSLAMCQLKSLLKTRILATCWFCKHPVTFILSMVNWRSWSGRTREEHVGVVAWGFCGRLRHPASWQGRAVIASTKLAAAATSSQRTPRSDRTRRSSSRT